MADTDLFLQLEQQKRPSPPPQQGARTAVKAPQHDSLKPAGEARTRRVTKQVKPSLRPAQPQTNQTKEPPVHGSIHQPTDQLVNRPLDLSVDQLTGKVVDRPVAFYLPEIINEKIDGAVDYMEKRHRVKVDRSAVVSAILGNPAVWEPESLNHLVNKAVSQLTSRLTSRLTMQ
jgi:hypothetical protein